MVSMVCALKCLFKGVGRWMVLHSVMFILSSRISAGYGSYGLRTARSRINQVLPYYISN